MRDLPGRCSPLPGLQGFSQAEKAFGDGAEADDVLRAFGRIAPVREDAGIIDRGERIAPTLLTQPLQLDRQPALLLQRLRVLGEKPVQRTLKSIGHRAWRFVGIGRTQHGGVDEHQQLQQRRPQRQAPQMQHKGLAARAHRTLGSIDTRLGRR